MSDMRKLLDVTDTRTRIVQQGLGVVGGILVAAGATVLITGSAPTFVGLGATVAAIILVVVTAGIKQRWEIEYRGHRIRFENSPVTAERLYLDDGLVARGGFGAMMELRAPIRVGDGAGETIVALVNAGQLRFRLRLFSEGGDVGGAHSGNVIEAEARAAAAYDMALSDERPVKSSAVLGRLILAKEIFEILGALAGLLGAASAALVWLF
ncbi:MAG TPA: hypothetical protein VGA70_08885 [Longimicrobiales bacterium]|jgi:hypothetical protein